MAKARPIRAQPETLRVRDIAPGFTVDDLQKSLALRGAMLRAGNCRIGLSQDDFARGRDRAKGVGMSIWLTTVQDLEALVARIKKNGITLMQELEEMPWGGRAFALTDPDGFRLTFTNEG